VADRRRRELDPELRAELVDLMVRQRQGALVDRIASLLDEVYLEAVADLNLEERRQLAADARAERQAFALTYVRERAAERGYTKLDDVPGDSGQAWASDASRRWAAINPELAALLRTGR